MALFPDTKIKQEACDYLMREGELTGQSTSLSCASSASIAG